MDSIWAPFFKHNTVVVMECMFQGRQKSKLQFVMGVLKQIIHAAPVTAHIGV